MGVGMVLSDWDKITDGLSCKKVDLPVGGLDPKSSFASAYHSVTSIRTRCHKNVETIDIEPPSYSAEAILSTKTSTGHKLAIRLLAAPEPKLEITVCSNDPEESANRLTSYETRYKVLTERISRIDEISRTRIVRTIEVEMKLDTTLHKLLTRAPVGEIYPPIGFVREVLIKTLEGFDPIHIETGDVMANLCALPQESPLDPEKSRSISMKILDWKMRLSRKIDEVSLPA